jgi:hypothetical protein
LVHQEEVAWELAEEERCLERAEEEDRQMVQGEGACLVVVVGFEATAVLLVA